METKKFHVKELSLTEQADVNGGFLLAFIAVMGAVIYLYNNKEDMIDGFKEGFESVRKTNN